MRRYVRPNQPQLTVMGAGGKPVVIRGFYASPEWRAIRKKVIEKYGRVCMACGIKTRGGTTHVDHIVPRSKNRALELEFTNLQILCKKCNESKRNLHATDYRPKYGGKTKSGIRHKTGSHWSDGYSAEEVLIAKEAVLRYRYKKGSNGT